MTRLVYRSAALADLDAIYDVIEPDSPRRALSFVTQFGRVVGRCAITPTSAQLATI